MEEVTYSCLVQVQNCSRELAEQLVASLDNFDAQLVTVVDAYAAIRLEISAVDRDLAEARAFQRIHFGILEVTGRQLQVEVISVNRG